MKEEGITLVALLITIIVIIILATISISMMQNSNIIEQGMDTADKYVNQGVEEEKEINKTSNVMKNIIGEYWDN